MAKSLYDFCVERNDLDLLRQWDEEKNGDLTPSDVLPGTHRKVWWICEKGHEWQAEVKSRAGSGTGCPVCANRHIIIGENDLASTYPDLAAQWHPEKNGKLTAEDVVAGTIRKVWWQCERGHEWRASIASRVAGAGCPVCAGKVVVPGENDLRCLYPAIAAEWHPTKNGQLSAEQVTPYANQKVWWVCPKGHEYQAMIASRTFRGNQCPYCTGRKVLPGFNDLATVEPTVAAQWHQELNGALTPEQVTVASHKKVWWQCPAGHVWKAVVYARTGERQRGCPVCAGKVSEKRQARYIAAMAETKVEHGESRI